MRWTSWLALGLWLLMLGLIAANGVMKALGWNGSNDTSVSGVIAFFFAFFAFATMGALVAARVPGNPLGWIFLAVGLLASFSGATEDYAYHGLIDAPGSLPGALFAGWIYAWAWYPMIGLIGLVLLLYPTGKVPGPRWRIVQWGFIALIALSTARSMFYPGPLSGSDTGRKLPDNPVGVGFVARLPDAFSQVGNLLGLVLVVAAVLSLVVRFRRSRGDERAQLKWMTYAVALTALLQVVPGVAGINYGGDVLFSVAIVQCPVAVGIAMLKYRLYEIDVIIRRTLVYGAVSAVLGGAYVGLVLAGQALLSSVAGGSNLAVAASTIVVAALFLPVRGRVQGLVERRFDRRRYDAQRTLEAFSARLREQVDLELLREGLLGVVDDTMRPAHVSLWLRQEASR